jgi:hypothetical protein
MKKLIFLIFILFISCSKSGVNITDKVYDVILIIGQSNTHYGIGYDSVLDAPDCQIYQLGRHFTRDLQVILAEEPLDHHTIQSQKIGFGLAFAKEYIQDNTSKEVLIIPCGYGGTGFIDNRWNKGDDLYNDAVDRVNFVLEKYPGSQIKVILWHQGEQDAIHENNNYQNSLDRFINDIRLDMYSDSVPFLLGGMVPYWVGDDLNRLSFQNIISETASRIYNTGYADPSTPFLIVKEDNHYDEIHYDANGQRELGKRYYQQYLDVISLEK